jgi:hypothetical protein
VLAWTYGALRQVYRHSLDAAGPNSEVQEAAMGVLMTPRSAHLVTRLAAAIILLGITGMACSAEDTRPRTKASIMKSSSDTQGTLAGNVKASIKSKRTSTGIPKTKSDTTKSSISNMK